MNITTVTNDAPFPVNATFESTGGPLLIQFAASGWSSKAGTIISAELQVDGATVVTTKVCTNEATSHKTMVPVAVKTCSIRAGNHTVTVKPGADTNLDQNDFFTITVWEFQLS